MGIGDAFFATFEPVRYRFGQDVEQQSLGFALLLLQLFVLRLQLLAAHGFQVAQALFLDGRGQARLEQNLAEGLGQIVLSAHFDAPHHVIDLLPARDHDDRKAPQHRAVLHFGQHLQAGHLGHLDIEQHQVKGFFLQALQGLAAVGGLFDVLDAQLAQRAGNAHAHHLAVVHHQEPCGAQHVGRFVGL